MSDSVLLLSPALLVLHANSTSGNTNTCANLKYCDLDPTDGTLQQYFTCKAHMSVPIPEGISWEEADAIQPLAIAVQLARRAALSVSKTGYIMIGGSGCEPLGLLVIGIAKAYGVRKIVVFNIEQSRLYFALSYGADNRIVSPKNSENMEPLKSASELTSSVLKEHDLGHGVDLRQSQRCRIICSKGTYNPETRGHMHPSGAGEATHKCASFSTDSA